VSFQGSVAPRGDLHLTVIRGSGVREERSLDGRIIAVDGHRIDHWDSNAKLRHLLRAHALPRRDLPQVVNEYRERNFRNVARGVPGVLAARQLTKRFGIPALVGTLYGRVIRGDGRVEELGLLGCKVVTTAGVNFLVDAWQNLTEQENLKFHGYGTGGAAEAIGNTALTTEETTQYNPDNTRPTGSLTEGASANIFRTVGTYTPDSGSTRAITEHGIFSQAATGGGTLWDRTLFSVVNLDSAAGDSLQTTYDCTVTAGS
jgi:hypothetical protein